MLRLVSGEWLSTNAADVTVLSKSDDFVVINKRYDLKVNSDDPSDAITVATQLHLLYPDAFDGRTSHGFRLHIFCSLKSQPIIFFLKFY